MEFDPSEDQAAFRDVVRKFARTELAPGYLERAKSESFPWAEHRAIAGLGVLGMLAGPERNPQGVEDYVAAGLVVEELAYADFNLANAVIPVFLMTSLIARHAGPDLREQWLEPLVTGQAYVALGLTEPDAGSDVTAIRTTATVDGDDYVIRGEKTSVTMLAHSDAILLVANTVRDGTSVGVSTFLVPLDLPDIGKAPIADTGWLPMGRGVLHLDGVRVPASALVGAEGAAFRSVLGGFDFTRPLLALTGIGCAQASVDETAEYLRSRRAFGAPLSRFEGASFVLAEHATQLEAARLLCYSTLWRRSVGKPHTALAAMTKWYGPQEASKAVHDCLLLHGNFGYSAEFPFEQRMRDVLAVEIADGTAQIQKIIIARELFGPDFVPYDRSRR
ncbi:acyl-CoA dehydrogenase family protein [Pseudonocardia sp. KRD291]|uniref:acyl-CoA dehydrogenase family protein n=1 Tax=Pseudonocardia sp. KRD291 TaxID=2792007 RepID=UPI001C4A2037|nr:acyl-CoA dehydrogenase family protein [Pseudonocardia sp. KRD291]MBW0101867.1 acyl-CoA dehydrogenase family protein [Pseudonocardia sp. KRD291]